MKKFLSIALIIIICCSSLCGCYTPEPFDVTFEDGTSSEMTTTEIIDLKNTDQKTFDTISMISGSGKIEKINVDTAGIKTWNAPDIYFLQIYIQDNINLRIQLNSDTEYYFQQNHQDIINKYEVGDIIAFTSTYIFVYDDNKRILMHINEDNLNFV